MGATPETLLRATDDYYHTMALAGTRQISDDQKSLKPWPEKEQLEQQWVSDFIEQELKKLGIDDYSTSETYTSPAGAVEHIRTDFRIHNDHHKLLIGNLTKALHPTPAVCGFPKDIALKMLKETETHNREYYTGFLGPLNIAGQNQLFVNLRCMKKNDGYYQLFTGGGITADSCADSEWHETEMKAAIMEKVLI
jgi:isochorismate synthase